MSQLPAHPAAGRPNDRELHALTLALDWPQREADTSPIRHATPTGRLPSACRPPAWCLPYKDADQDRGEGAAARPLEGPPLAELRRRFGIGSATS